MTRRRSALANLKASVAVERAGAMIKVDDVPAAQAGVVLADILQAFRAIARKYPEVVADLDPVPGGYPVDASEDGWADESRKKKRVGF